MTDWFDVAPAGEFGPGQSRLISVESTTIAVFNLDGQYYAVEDVCSHDGSAMLGCGLDQTDIIEGDQIICPRHGARFCIRTGAALTLPAYDPLACFPVCIENNMVKTRDNRWD